MYPTFLDQLELLAAAAQQDAGRGNVRGGSAKLLMAIQLLVFDHIPRDPGDERYRQGGTLGKERKHWFRAKFGGGRFRLFFRYRKDVRLIVYAWVNDASTLRTYGAATDAYAVFRRMLDSGNPPDEWNALVEASTTTEAAERMRTLAYRLGLSSG